MIRLRNGCEGAAIKCAAPSTAMCDGKLSPRLQSFIEGWQDGTEVTIYQFSDNTWCIEMSLVDGTATETMFLNKASSLDGEHVVLSQDEYNQMFEKATVAS